MRKQPKAFSKEEQAELTAKRAELARVKAKCEKDFIQNKKKETKK